MVKICSFDIPRDELNGKLGGGFPVGSLVVIEGGSGGGKSSISHAFHSGLMRTK